MKIAVASSGLGHVSRGIESWASDLGHALAIRGEQVILCKGAGDVEADFERVIPAWTRESAPARRALRLLPRSVGWRLGLGSAYQVEQSTFALGLLNLLRRERIDVLHVQDPRIAVLIQRAGRLGLVRTRTILAHGTEEPPEFLRGLDFVQHLAPWHLEWAREAGAWKPAWTAIPNFIETGRYRPGDSEILRAELGLQPDDLVVLTAAAIKRGHKRVDYLLEEFAALVHERPDLPIRLVVAGGWEAETDELVSLGRRMLGDRVRFLVRFPRERMPDLYRAADLFVLCSLSEMMPIALLEAISSGLPCLVHDHPILKWIIGPGGLAIALDQPGALASSMRDLLTDAESRKAAGSRARQHAVAHFSSERVVDQILDYYSAILRSSPSGPRS